MNAKKFFQIVIILSCFSYIGCGVHDSSITNIDAEEIMFMNSKEKPLDSFFTEYILKREYVNLEIKGGDSSFILVDKLVNRNNKIYILDKRKAILAIYDSIGNLSSILKDKTHFSKIADFDVDDTGLIFVLDGKFERLLCYNSDYTLVYKRSLPYETDIVKHLKNGDFLFSLSSWNDRLNKNDKLIRTDSAFHVLEKYLKYDDFVDHNYWIKGYRFLSVGNKVYYNRPVDNLVYVLSAKGDMLNSYYFDFGNMNVPDKDKKDIEKNFTKYSNYRVLTDFIFINDKFALGKIWDKRKFRFFYLDRGKNEVLLENTNRSTELKYVGDFDGQNLISIIYPGEFNESDYGYLPAGQKQWLQKGGFVLCKYLLK